MDKKSEPVSLTKRWERAQSLRQSGDDAGAARELAALLERDPERCEAWQAMGELCAARGLERAANEYLGNMLILAQAAPANGSEVAEPLAQAYRLLAQGNSSQALALIQTALVAGQGNRLSVALEAQAAWQAEQADQAQAICQSALYYWPACVQLHVILAECLTAQGKHDLAVEHVRLARWLDPEGEVAKKWGDKVTRRQGDKVTTQTQQPTVEQSTSQPVNRSIGQSVNQSISDQVTSNEQRATRVQQKEGGSQKPEIPNLQSPISNTQPPIPDAQSSTQHGVAEDVVSVMRETFDQLVRTLDGHPRRPKPRKPFHAIISAREPLARLCGSRASIVERAMADLAATITRYDGVTAEALFVDDAGSLALFGLGPVQSCDATSIKRLLDALDDALDMRGLQLTSVLIVGGDEVIPFHRLPNPTEDPDADVPTDAPYACRNNGQGQLGESSILLPDRLVGRMPHGTQVGAADMLLLQLGTALQARVEPAHSASHVARSTPGLLGWLTSKKQEAGPARSFGYAASVWRRAAQEVFSVIGPAQAMRLSPPLGRPDVAVLLNQVRPQLAYFNLHGLPDSPHWYGQRDPEFAANYAQFPVALSPSDINRPVSVVFTAACYGVYPSGRDFNTSIALRFMQGGTLALVGSTTVAYGGLDKPLVGVDLLGQLFWQHIVAGQSAGEALRQAKIGFVNQMQGKQGYLDGEDQKTLASFILLGDPLLVPLSASSKTSLSEVEKQASSRLQAVLRLTPLCMNGAGRQARVDMPEEQIRQVKQHVAHSLPEMAQAAVQNSEFRIQNSEFKMVSLSKTLPYDDHRGVQLVRVTLDNAGKIVKLAVSK